MFESIPMRSSYVFRKKKKKEKKKETKEREEKCQDFAYSDVLIIGEKNFPRRDDGGGSPISRGNGRETFFPPHCHAIRTPIRNIGHRRSAIIMSVEYKWSIGGHGSTSDGTRLSCT